MSQIMLLEDEAPRFDPALGEPVIWLQQLVLLGTLETPEPIRDISFRLGLNIVATEEALPKDTLPVGHDVGKTMLVRIIRYCLGEEHYCDQETRAAVADKLPDAYVLAKCRVAGETWCIARPLGNHSGVSCSWCQQTDDLESIRHPEERRRYADFVDALNEATKACYADIGLPYAENRRARWQDLLGWLSRDQECLFRHQAEWRVTESQAGPRVLRREDAYLVMRMALGLLNNEEIEAASQYESLRASYQEKESYADKIAAFLERTEQNLKAALKSRQHDPDAFPGDGLLSPALVAIADSQILSLSELLQEVWERRDIQDAQAALDTEIEQQAILQQRINEQSAEKDVLEKHLNELHTQDAESFQASLGESGFSCLYWPGDKETAKAAGCPGEDSTLKADDGSDLRRKANIRKVEMDIESISSVLRQSEHELTRVRARMAASRANLRAQINQLFHDRQGIAEAIGRWKEIKQQAEDFQSSWQEHDQLRQELEHKESVLRPAREEVAAKREAFAKTLGILSLCYRDIVRAILSQNVEGKIIVDGNGVRPEVTGASSSGTTLKMCTHVLAFDFACLKASLCGVGHLPRIWMHDSPRAADTEDTLYHRLMQIIANLEAEFGDTPPTFQHIWTTTSTPPEILNKEPFICLRLHARNDDGRLLRQRFGMGALESSPKTERGESF